MTLTVLHSLLTQIARCFNQPEAANLELGRAFTQRTLDTFAGEVDIGGFIPTIEGYLYFQDVKALVGGGRKDSSTQWPSLR